MSGTKTTYKLAGGIYEVIVDGSTTTQKSYVDGVIMNNRVLTNGRLTPKGNLRSGITITLSRHVASLWGGISVEIAFNKMLIYAKVGHPELAV